jgi:hypothetical protein
VICTLLLIKDDILFGFLTHSFDSVEVSLPYVGLMFIYSRTRVALSNGSERGELS